ncbi:MAG: hypothetical protein V7K67_15140 [Nostoc sp.]
MANIYPIHRYYMAIAPPDSFLICALLYLRGSTAAILTLQL